MWRDAKKLGYLEQFEASRPVVKPVIYALYDAFSSLRREAKEMKYIKRKEIEKAVESIYYEQDKAIEIIQKADNHYLALCAAKLKRMNANK